MRPPAGSRLVLLFEDEARFGRISEGRRRCSRTLPRTAPRGASGRAPVRLCRGRRQPLGRAAVLAGVALDGCRDDGRVFASHRQSLRAGPLHLVSGPSGVARRRGAALAPGHEVGVLTCAQPRTRIRPKACGGTSANTTSARARWSRCRPSRRLCARPFRPWISSLNWSNPCAVTAGSKLSL